MWRALAARATSKPRVMFLNVRGNQVQHISGSGAPAQAIIEAAGGIAAGAAGISGYKSITPEALVAGQSDYYLVFQFGLSSVDGADACWRSPMCRRPPPGRTGGSSPTGTNCCAAWGRARAWRYAS